MDELKPSPRNELLFSIAEKLRGAPAKLGRANPILGRLSSMVLGDIPKGLEHWAYGDSPLGPPANAPAVRIDRALPMLEAAPIGVVGSALGKGVAMAQLVPALPLRNVDVTAAKRLADRIRLANDAEKSGATKDEIWKMFGLTEAPGNIFPGRSGKLSNAHTAPETGAYHTKWLEEIDPENRLKPLSSINRAKYVNQVFDSPELFRQYPFLKDIEFKLDNPRKNLGGLFEPGMGERGRMSVYKELDDPALQGVAAHELSHGIMHNFGQVNSLGHGAEDLTPEMRNRINNMAGYMQVDPFAAEKYGNVPDQMLEFAKMPSGRTSNRTGSWDRSAGEALAEAVRTRLRIPTDMRKAVDPSYAYPKDPLLSDVIMDRSA